MERVCDLIFWHLLRLAELWRRAIQRGYRWATRIGPKKPLGSPAWRASTVPAAHHECWGTVLDTLNLLGPLLSRRQQNALCRHDVNGKVVDEYQQPARRQS
jgi:hypothetical protein